MHRVAPFFNCQPTTLAYPISQFSLIEAQEEHDSILAAYRQGFLVGTEFQDIYRAPLVAQEFPEVAASPDSDTEYSLTRPSQLPVASRAPFSAHVLSHESGGFIEGSARWL